MAGRHEEAHHQIETYQKEALKTDRERIMEARMGADHEYCRRTREAMRLTLDSQDGSVSSIERVVWGLTGSDEELQGQQELADRIGNSAGQPLLALQGEGRGFLGFINGGLEGQLIDDHWGQLQVHLGRTVHWNQDRPGPRGEWRVDDEAKMALYNIHYRDTDLMGCDVQDTDPIESATEPTCTTLLVGMHEILENEGVDLKEYAEQFALLTSVDDSVQ